MSVVISREEDRTRAVVVSFLFHAVLIAIIILWRFSASETPEEAPMIVVPLEMSEWGGGGDNAAAGEPDKGMNSDYTPPGEDMTATPSPAATPTPAPKAEAPKATSTPSPTTTDPNVAALRQKQAEEQRQRDEQARQEAARQAEAERQRIAAEQARQAEEARRNKVKNDAGSAFGKKNSNGQGAGGGGNPGNGGAPDGTGNNPFGKSAGDGGGSGGGSGTGTGVSIGGGLSGRKLVGRPKMVDNTQKTGKVVVQVCVDGSGNVISADYTLTGSTTNDSELRAKAISWAKQHKFAASNNAKECGTIAFNFQVK